MSEPVIFLIAPGFGMVTCFCCFSFSLGILQEGLSVTSDVLFK